MKLFIALVLSLIAASAAQAKIVSRAVPYEHAGVKLEGWLVYDDEKTVQGKVPGVLVIHEWWGLTEYSKKRAEQLAKLGYVAFAADMFGAGVTTRDAKQAGGLANPFYGKPLMAERAQAGLEQLLKTGMVDAEKVAAIGFCFGGTVCQELAYSGAPLAGIVSFHGSLVPASPEAAAKNKARFLVCHGAIDPFVTADSVAAFQKSLDAGKVDYQFVSYAGAKHAFTNKDADKLAEENGITGIGFHAVAEKRAWSHMRTFLSELFPKK